MNLEDHQNHPFYQEAHADRERVRQDQIKKGWEKYPRPFSPDDWTNQELADHAMQENVDQAHYISGMRRRMFDQAALIERLYTAINLMAEESKKKHVDRKKIDSLQRSAIQLSDGHMLPPLS